MNPQVDTGGLDRQNRQRRRSSRHHEGQPVRPVPSATGPRPPQTRRASTSGARPRRPQQQPHSPRHIPESMNTANARSGSPHAFHLDYNPDDYQEHRRPRDHRPRSNPKSRRGSHDEDAAKTKKSTFSFFKRQNRSRSRSHTPTNRRYSESSDAAKKSTERKAPFQSFSQKFKVFPRSGKVQRRMSDGSLGFSRDESADIEEQLPMKRPVHAVAAAAETQQIINQYRVDQLNGADRVQMDESQGQQLQTHPFVLPAQLKLSPRADLWVAFSVVSCGAVSSMAMIMGLTSRSSGNMGNIMDKLALSVCAMSFGFSMIVALGFRYAPARRVLTTPSKLKVGSGLVGFLAKHEITPELSILSILTVLWIIGIPIIAGGDPSSPSELTLAVAGVDIWNANLFYSSWASCLFCVYLTVEVYTLSDRGGAVPRAEPVFAPDQPSKRDNTLSKRWILISIIALVILSSTVNTYTGPMCEGLLVKTDYCERTLVGVVLGGFLELIICIGAGVLYRLSSMIRPTRRHHSDSLRRVLLIKTRNKICSLLAFMSLVIQGLSAGVLTSPTGGGPASQSGTTYFASWLGVLLAFELCLRYVELFTTGNATAHAGRTHKQQVLLVANGSPSRAPPAKSRMPSTASSTTSSSGEDEDANPIEVITSDQEEVFSDTSMTHYSLPQKPPSVRTDPSSGGHIPPVEPHDDPTVNRREGLEPEEDGSWHGTSNSANISRSTPPEAASVKQADPSAGLPDVSSTNDSYIFAGSNSTDPSFDRRPSDSVYQRDPSSYFRRSDDDSATKYSTNPFDNQTPFAAQKAEELDHHQEPEVASTYSTHINSGASTQSPLEEDSNTSPFTEKPSIAESYTEKPFSAESFTEQPSNSESYTEKPFSVESFTEQPSISESYTEKPFSAEPVQSSSNITQPNHGAGGNRSVKSGSSRKKRSSKKSSEGHSSSASGKHRRQKSGGNKKLPSISTSTPSNGSFSVIATESTDSQPPPTVSDTGSVNSNSISTKPQSRTKSRSSSRKGSDNGGSSGIQSKLLSRGTDSFTAHRDIGDDHVDNSTQFSQALSSLPMTSIETRPGSSIDSETVVSDPTIDASFDPPALAATVMSMSTASSRKARSKAPSLQPSVKVRSNVSVNSHEYKRSSSDENPSSVEVDNPGNSPVDDIVAAALAYAEKTHNEEGYSQHSARTTSTGRKTPSQSNASGSGKQQSSANRQQPPESSDVYDESIHSFYSDSQNVDQRSGKSRSSGEPRQGNNPVDNLVAQALSQVEAAQAWNAHHPPPPKRQNNPVFRSDVMSVGSMYSDTTEYTNQEAGQDFHC